MNEKVAVCDGKGGILYLTPEECAGKNVIDFSDSQRFDRYLAGKVAQTYEELLAEMGSGPNAHRLPAPPDYSPGEDGIYAHVRYVQDH